MFDYCFDTETTGLIPGTDRIIEIACVELENLLPTGRIWRSLINPQRDIPAEVIKIHGITDEMVRDKPIFADVIGEFLAFTNGGRLVAHNAKFDIDMVNAELELIGMPPLANQFIDTVSLARKQFPGAKVTLDNLCRRFGIDISKRVKHEALLDTQLLARVYLELNGGRHRKLELVGSTIDMTRPTRPFRSARDIGAPSQNEEASHSAFLGYIKNPIWATEAHGPTPGP